MKYKIIGGKYDGAFYLSTETLPYATKLVLGSIQYVLTPIDTEPKFIIQKEL